jgi:hypothetical protein
MRTEDALAFLAQHQPMPDDSVLDDDTIRRYEEVRLHFVSHPDDRCVALLLNSFGDGNGFGVYQLVDDVLRGHPRTVVTAALRSAIGSPQASVRGWALQFAADFADRSMLSEFVRVLERSRVSDERFWAAVALKQVVSSSDSDLALVHRLASTETDKDVRTHLLQALSGGGGS